MTKKLNLEEWKNIKIRAFRIIKEGLDKSIEKEYYYMQSFGITPTQESEWPYYIQKAIDLLNENKEYGGIKSLETIPDGVLIQSGIEGFIKGLQDTKLWDIIFDNSRPDILVELFYNNIVCQLENYYFSYVDYTDEYNEYLKKE